MIKTSTEKYSCPVIDFLTTEPGFKATPQILFLKYPIFKYKNNTITTLEVKYFHLLKYLKSTKTFQDH